MPYAVTERTTMLALTMGVEYIPLMYDRINVAIFAKEV